MMNVSQAVHALRATVVREFRRSVRRTEQLDADLADPRLTPYLAAVDAQRPGLAATERVRLARILAGVAGTGRVRVAQVLGAA